MSHLDSYKWFRKTQVIPEYVVLYNKVGILLGGCLTCEELVGVTHTEEVKVSPVLTTATKVLFPNTISVRVFEVGEVLLGGSAF